MKELITVFILFFSLSLNGQGIEKKALKYFYKIVDQVNIHLSHTETFNFNKETGRIYFSGMTQMGDEYRFSKSFNKQHNSENFIRIDTVTYKLDSFGSIKVDVEKKESIQLGRVRYLNIIEDDKFESKKNEDDIYIEISNEIKYDGYSYFIVWIETRNTWCKNIVFLKLNSKGKLIDWVSEYGTL